MQEMSLVGAFLIDLEEADGPRVADLRSYPACQPCGSFFHQISGFWWRKDPQGW